jgi:hypothetical protein
MITIFTNITKFVTDPKNTRMIMLGAMVVLAFLLLRQCNATKSAKEDVELQKQETKRVANNYDAAMDTINQYQVDGNTWRAEKLGYELTLDELNNKYADLLGDFEVEKSKPPKVIIKTEYIIKEVINNVPVLVEVDSLGNTSLAFNDSTYHDSINYRFLGGTIPYKIAFDSNDSLYKVVPEYGSFNLTLGMNLNLGLFQDKDTRKISIVADTDYPGVTFTNIEGASIMDDPDNKKILRKMRKPWGIGLNVGYGFIVDPTAGEINTGPYFGIGLSYTPKFLQWGR